MILEIDKFLDFFLVNCLGDMFFFCMILLFLSLGFCLGLRFIILNLIFVGLIGFFDKVIVVVMFFKEF